MKREILINATQRETRVAIMEDDELVELLVDRPDARRMVGDIYLGKVEAVLPGIQAAFVDIGTEKSAFLHASDLVVPDEDLSLADGAIAPWTGFRSRYFDRVLEAVADEFRFGTETPWKRLGKRARNAILNGTGDRAVHVRYRNRYGRQRSYHTAFEGVIPWLERRHADSESDRARELIEGYMREVPCPACGGARLRPAPPVTLRRREPP